MAPTTALYFFLASIRMYYYLEIFVTTPTSPTTTNKGNSTVSNATKGNSPSSTKSMTPRRHRLNVSYNPRSSTSRNAAADTVVNFVNSLPSSIRDSISMSLSNSSDN